MEILMMVVIVMTATALVMMTLSRCTCCVVRLAVTPSQIFTHWSMNVSRLWRYGGLGTSDRGRLQISQSEHTKVVWHGGQHEELVVQELWKVPLGNRVPPSGFF
jgi:hypothetical protein